MSKKVKENAKKISQKRHKKFCFPTISPHYPLFCYFLTFWNFLFFVRLKYGSFYWQFTDNWLFERFVLLAALQMFSWLLGRTCWLNSIYIFLILWSRQKVCRVSRGRLWGKWITFKLRDTFIIWFQFNNHW